MSPVDAGASVSCAFPFEKRLGYFAGATHEEALARLEYLVETGQRCGLVAGPRGTGKSTVLRVFADKFRSDFTIVSVEVAAVRAADALERLSNGLGTTTHARGRLNVAWQEVMDGLAGQRHARRPCAVIFDHVDRASADCQEVVRGLLAHETLAGTATFVLAFSGEFFPIVAKEWRQLADLKIELAPLTAAETAALVRALLSTVDLPADALDDSAMESLFRLTHGVPRDVVRLCEMSLLSAVHDEKPAISEDVVHSAMRELSLLRSSA